MRETRLKRFVIDRDDADGGERLVLRGKIEKLEHGRADGPLVTDERYDNI